MPRAYSALRRLHHARRVFSMKIIRVPLDMRRNLVARALNRSRNRPKRAAVQVCYGLVEVKQSASHLCGNATRSASVWHEDAVTGGGDLQAHRARAWVPLATCLMGLDDAPDDAPAAAGPGPASVYRLLGVPTAHVVQLSRSPPLRLLSSGRFQRNAMGGPHCGALLVR